MPRQKETPAIPTVHEALDVLTIEQLQPLVALLPTQERPSRKGELIALIEQYLAGKQLRALWEQLDATQQLAVAETIHYEHGVFHAHRFRAKYGALPVFGTKKDAWGYGEIPSLLRLFMYRASRYGDGTSVVPTELQHQLRGYVPKPSGPVLTCTDALPEQFELVEKEYEWQEGDQGITIVMGKRVLQMPRQQPKTTTLTYQLPLTHRDTERAAQQDLHTVLRLVDKGRIAVSERPGKLPPRRWKRLPRLLRDGDFYELTPKKNTWDQTIGPIKAYAWPLLVQAAKLAERHGKKLALTKAGRHALGAPAADTLRLTWQRWLKTKP